jgi:Cap4 dsDNA endonuclease
MVDVSRSQSGGVATWRGLDYQKRYIAYLAIQMLSDQKQIKRITCESLDDIEVEEESKIVYYQVKTTTSDALKDSKIIDSIKLFAFYRSYKC